jgi:hypothetical protein
MMYMLRCDRGIRVRVGWQDTAKTFLVLVEMDGEVVDRFESELASTALDFAQEYMPDRVASVFLYKLVVDQEGLRVPTQATRHHCATCPECPHLDACRNGLVECCKL